MTSPEPKTSDEQTSTSTNDATVSEVLSAWERVLQGLKATIRTNVDLVAADFRLSIKAIVVCLVCVFIFVGLVLAIWATLMAGLFYGLTTFGLHWLWAMLAVLLLNCLALLVTKKILVSALSSVAMKTSIEQLFHSDKG